MARNNWTREETIIAFNVYCKIPFKSSSKKNPVVIKYANLIGRSPSALNMKIGNLGRLDPELKKRGISGLKKGSKMDETVWNEFNGDWEKLAYESEILIARYKNKSIEESFQINTNDSFFPQGRERERIVKQRVNQYFFRSTILSSYDSKCAITGLSIPDFLVASHIIPWSIDKENRINPRNGICLNSLHDKAFDRGFITITTDYKVKLSSIFESYIKDSFAIDFFLKYDNQKISLPDKFVPSKDFLDYHSNAIFKK